MKDAEILADIKAYDLAKNKNEKNLFRHGLSFYFRGRKSH